MAVGNRSIKMLDLIHQNFSFFVFCRRKSYKFGMTLGCVNYDRIFISIFYLISNFNDSLLTK